MKYKVNEIFESVQGEGTNLGRKVVFIRLSGCNRSCGFCDTDHRQGRKLTVAEIGDALRKFDCRSVIITGGEPSIWPLHDLLMELRIGGYWIGIETNGSTSLDEYGDFIDYIAVSPKDKHIRQTTADEVRVVVTEATTAADIRVFQRLIRSTRYYLSPRFDDAGYCKDSLVSSIYLLGELNNVELKWELSFQWHKILGIR